jgi:hypothetical protein
VKFVTHNPEDSHGHHILIAIFWSIFHAEIVVMFTVHQSTMFQMRSSIGSLDIIKSKTTYGFYAAVFFFKQNALTVVAWIFFKDLLPYIISRPCISSC